MTFAARATPAGLCSNFSMAPMRPPPTPPNGTEPIWIVERRRHSIGRCANSCSIGGRLSSALRFGGLGPPSQIVGEARKPGRQLPPGFPAGLARRAQGGGNWADGKRARNDHHTHLGQGPVPKEPRARPAQAPGGVARDRGRTPEPLLEKMVGEVLQTGLHPPVVFSDDEDE